jgi:hypothetical protein
MVKGRGWLMNLKRNSCSCCLPLTLQRRCTKIFLWKDWWWFDHHSFLLRASSGSSQSSRERNHNDIFLCLVIITKRKLFDIKKKIRVEDRNILIKRQNKLTSQAIQTSEVRSLWQQRTPLMHLLESRYPRKPSLMCASSFSLDLYPQSWQGGGNVVESLSSRESLASSPSWFLPASGALESAGARSASIGPSSGRWGRETKNWWSYKEHSKNKHNE